MPKIRTTKKKQSKLSRLGNLLKPNTPKKRLLLFALVFALGGGGYAVHKSSAASWSVSADNLSIGGGTYRSTDCNGNKGCVRVVKLPSPISSTVPYAEGKIYINFPGPTNIVMCLTARGQVSSAHRPSIHFYDNDITPGRYLDTIGFGSWFLPKDTIYREYCGATTVSGGSHFLYPRVRSTTSGTSEVYITNITMKW